MDQVYLIPSLISFLSFPTSTAVFLGSIYHLSEEIKWPQNVTSFPFSYPSALCWFYSCFYFPANPYLMLGLFVHICLGTYVRLNIASLPGSQGLTLSRTCCLIFTSHNFISSVKIIFLKICEVLTKQLSNLDKRRQRFLWSTSEYSSIYSYFVWIRNHFLGWKIEPCYLFAL